MTDTTQTKPKRVRPKSRPQRWADAVGECLAAFGAIEEAVSKLESAIGDLRSVQEEYEEWKDNLPDNMQSGAVADKLEEVCNLEIEDIFETLNSAVEEAKGKIEEAEGVDLPMGFGRD